MHDVDDTHPLLLDGYGEGGSRAWSLAGEGVAALAMVLGLLSAIVVIVPADGRVSVALHDVLAQGLGRATFMVPVVLFAAGVLTLVHRFAPNVPLPMGRLLGLALIGLAALPAEQLLAGSGEGTGRIGQVLAASLIEWFGGPATVALLAAGVLVGVLLALDVSVADIVARVRAARLSRVTALPQRTQPRSGR
jgi:hypothetical protein